MRILYKMTAGISGAVLTVALTALILAGCATSGQSGTAPIEKSGAQLWGENCIRCHNTPDPPAFSDVEWETIGMHMRVRANLTDAEVAKIVEFLQLANG